jgi:hypothetical protein
LSKIARETAVTPTPPKVPPSTAPAVAPAAQVPACCADSETLKRLDGQRVALVGTYKPVFVTKRPAKAEKLAAAGSIAPAE